MAKHKCITLLIVSVLSLGFQLAPLAAQDNPDPDALLASEQQAWSQLEQARKAMVQEPWETAEEFTARVQAFDSSSEALAQAWRSALESLESADFVVPASKVSWTVQPFDRATKAWTFTVTSADPAVPFKGNASYSIAEASDLKSAFSSVDTAIASKVLQFRIHYRIGRTASGQYRVHSLLLRANDGSSELFALEAHKAWRFATAQRSKPHADSFIPMVTVAGGTFTMGNTAGDGEGDEEPLHKVTLSSFRMGLTEVTQAQWRAVMGTNPGYFTGDTLPIEDVSWFDAVVFCNKLSQKEGLSPAYIIKGETVTLNPKANGYRLPTEAYWEYAAKGGPKQQAASIPYAGSKNLDEIAWFDDNSGYDTNDPGTKPVASKKPNALGLYDMSGNVWEWCWDWYNSYSTASQTDPTGAASGSYRVYRGGSWGYDASVARLADRSGDSPDRWHSLYGFRVLLPQSK